MSNLRKKITNIFIGLGLILVLFFASLFIIPNIFSDKIMDNANPDYYKEGIVTAIAADKIKIKSDNKEYGFNLSSTSLNFLVKIKKDTQKSLGNLSDIKVGDKVEVEGWEMKDEVVVSSIYLIR